MNGADSEPGPGEDPPVTGPHAPSFRRMLATTTGGMNALGTALIFAIMLLVNADIFFRFAFNTPIRGVAELVSLSIVGIVFLQLPHTLREGQIPRADLLLAAVTARWTGAAQILTAVHSMIGFTLFAILAWANWRPLAEAYTMGQYLGSPGDFTAPTWPMFLMIVSGAAVMSLQYFATSIAEFRAAFTCDDNKEARP